MTTLSQYFPEGSASTNWVPLEERLKWVNFGSLPPRLRGENTHIIYLAPNGSMWNLAGPRAGKQGVRLNRSLVGDQNWPFDLVTTESAYMMGAEIDRVNVRARTFNLGVIIGGHTPVLTEYQMRMAEAHWWDGQDEDNDGWVGIYTRYTGWRWCPVRPYQTVGTPQALDSTAYGNNTVAYDLTWYAQRPYFTKPALYRTFEASKAGPPVQKTWLDEPVYMGTLPIANRGELTSYVSFVVSSPGQASVQDNNSDRMVELPYTSAADGDFLVDTEPGHRTLTAANDAVDNLFFKIARSSKILNFFLHDLTNLGLPMQLRFDKRFVYSIPPKTVVTFTVGHTNPNGTITAFVPQRFKRSR